MRHVVCFFIACCASSALRAEDEMTWSGSLAGRAQGTVISGDAPSSTKDVPVLHALVEANLQGRARFFDRRVAVMSDVSAFAQHGFFYIDDGEGLLDHDVPENHPRLVVSELYLRAEIFEHLDVSIGKQRVVWGSGIANNPTDVVNPPRDPTDPGFQRTGVWQLKVDIPVDNITWSAFFAPTVLHTEAGIPYAVLWFPDWRIDGGAKRDDELHWSAGARLYALVADTDVNLWMVWSNLAGDAFEDKARFMASVSRLVGEEVEVHGEVMLQTGTTRSFVDPDCVDDEEALFSCAFQRKAPIGQTQLDDPELSPRALLGFRWLPADESILTVEYLYAADGYDNDELKDLYALQGLVRDLPPQLVPAQPTATSDGLPARVGVDAVRTHTLFLSYSKPRILDDFTFTAGAVVAPEDLSSVLNASVLWSAQEWLNLTAFVFVPTPHVLGDVGTFDAGPFDARFVLEARAFF